MKVMMLKDQLKLSKTIDNVKTIICHLEGKNEEQTQNVLTNPEARNRVQALRTNQIE